MGLRRHADSESLLIARAESKRGEMMRGRFLRLVPMIGVTFAVCTPAFVSAQIRKERVEPAQEIARRKGGGRDPLPACSAAKVEAGGRSKSDWLRPWSLMGT